MVVVVVLVYSWLCKDNNRTKCISAFTNINKINIGIKRINNEANKV